MALTSGLNPPLAVGGVDPAAVAAAAALAAAAAAAAANAFYPWPFWLKVWEAFFTHPQPPSPCRG